MTDFTFDLRTRQYRDKVTGRFLSKSAVRNMVDRHIENRQSRVTQLTNKMIDGDITLQQWERQLSSEIKTVTIQLYKLGRPELNQSDYGTIGSILKSQYARLRKLSLDISLGTLSEAQIRDRAVRYIRKMREAFEEGDRRGNKLINRWEKRYRTKNESCQQCIAYEAMGWQPIGTLPRPTEKCDCRDRCGCGFLYSNSQVRPNSPQLLTNSFGWL